jgi:mRNA-degrading endonuclease RelE of RelBE toxin-antitoxin system
VRDVRFTPDAVRQFKRLSKAARAFIKEAVRTHLLKADPAQATRNKFRLRRASPFADYELRASQWRVFYRVDGEGVLVTLIGENSGNVLLVEGEVLKL